MKKKIILNILILIFCVFVPLCLINQYRDNIILLKSIQFPVHIIIFISFIILAFLNHKFRKQALSKKWVWLIFEVIGVIGLVYSGGILWLLYEFRHGIGF